MKTRKAESPEVLADFSDVKRVFDELAKAQATPARRPQGGKSKFWLALKAARKGEHVEIMGLFSSRRIAERFFRGKSTWRFAIGVGPLFLDKASPFIPVRWQHFYWIP